MNPPVAARIAICTVALHAACSHAATAQARQCVWPAVQARCSAWLITEAGVHVRFTDLQSGDERVLITYSLGWMRNAGVRTAVGVELFAGVEGEVRGGAGVRFRKWLSSRDALDLTTGVHFFGDASSQEVSAGSPMFSVRLAHADLIAATGRVDVLKLNCAGCPAPTTSGGTSTRAYLGAEVGSKAGVVAMLVTGVLAALFAASYGS
jgi:hypothetical protein